VGHSNAFVEPEIPVKNQGFIGTSWKKMGTYGQKSGIMGTFPY
jgi:hypothetical protein